jgi:signal transduction histidine kinase
VADKSSVNRLVGSELARARRRLWGVTFTVLGGLSIVLVYVSSADSAGIPRPDFLPGRSILVLGLAGALVVFSLYVFDTERKLRRLADRLLEEQLAARKLETERAEQRDFVSMAAHELRAPLTAIKGFTRTLMTRFHQLEDDRRDAYLSLVNDQSNRLARLVDDLMAVSRIDSGHVMLERVPTDLVALARQVVEEFHSKWTGRTIDVHAAVGLPLAFCDRHKVEETLVNLIDNAVKYSPHGEPVKVAINVQGRALEVSVHDRGPGMTPDDVASLFHKFHRLPAAIGADIPGTGLGLYIVRGLVEAHGGSVHVESIPGAGSTFSFSLPAALPIGEAPREPAVGERDVVAQRAS